jgi:hypothetical protein
MAKPIQKAPQRVYNDLPEYQVVDLRESNQNEQIFHASLVDGKTVFYLAGPGTVLIDIETSESGFYQRVEVYGGKNSWTKPELERKATEIYNEIQMFLVSAHSWVFLFAE